MHGTQKVKTNGSTKLSHQLLVCYLVGSLALSTHRQNVSLPLESNCRRGSDLQIVPQFVGSQPVSTGAGVCPLTGASLQSFVLPSKRRSQTRAAVSTLV